MVKGDPVDDLDTPMREFMEWERCPQSFNQEDRIYHWREVVDSNSILFSSIRDIQKSGTLSLWPRCKHTAKTRSF